MKAIDPILLDALEKGKGTPVMVCALYQWIVDGWSLKGEYEIFEAILTRNRYDIHVKENLLADGLVDSVVTSGWAIEVERGLIVAGTKYSLVSNLYYISTISYADHEGETHIIADLLPATSIVGIDGTQTARQVISQAFAQFNNLATVTFDTNRDIWFDWKFYDTDKELNLIDGRTLEHVIQQKYFAYLFPRWFHLIYAYGAASNEDNNVDGTYTPFEHARTTCFLWPDKPVNLTWDSETGFQEYIDQVTNPRITLGFISDADDPRALSTFQKWTRIFNGYCLQYIQRPDLRLEQGDLLSVATDGFSKTRCFEQIEVYKSRSSRARQDSPAAWYQIVRQLPYHPEYTVSNLPIDWWQIGTPGGRGWPGLMGDPGTQKVMSASFTGILNPDASSLQQAFELLDKKSAGLQLQNVFQAKQKIDINSTTALVVEQDGVKDNILVVDTINGYVGIGVLPARSLHVGHPTLPYVHLTNNESGHGSYDGLTIGFTSSTDTPASVGYIRMRENLPLQFYTNDLKRLSVNANGDLSLETSAGGSPSLLFTEASVQLFAIQYDGSPSNPGNLLKIRGAVSAGSALSDIVTFTQSGRMGIGGTPASKFHVIGSADIIQAIIKANSTQTANILEIQDSGGNPLLQITPAGDIPSLVKHALATAEGDFLVASGSGAFVKKTLAETRAILNIDQHPVSVLLNTSSALAAGDDAARLRVPAKLDGLKLVGVAASRKSGTGTLTLMIRNVTDSQDMLSTPLTIDSGETDSLTAATPAVIDPVHNGVSTGDQLAIDVDDEGTDTLYAIVELTFG